MLLAVAPLLIGQQTPPASQAPPQPPAHTDEKPEEKPPEPKDKRIFGVLPNYRTAGYMDHYEPITAKAKFTIAAKDSFDWNIFLLAGAFSGLADLEASSPSFGHGLKAYAHYYGAAFADQAIGNFMSEAIFPSLLHEDPRYFRRGTGPGWVRVRSAMGQIFWTRKDSGGREFNFSEIVGNATSVAISNAYYPDNRNVQDNLQKWGTAVATDLVSNILKEFWPDVKRKFFNKHKSGQ